jgi:hypothetical protein
MIKGLIAFVSMIVVMLIVIVGFRILIRMIGEDE